MPHAMISETLNALFITYLVSEYLVETNHHHHRDRSSSVPFHKRDWTRRLLTRHVGVSALALFAINLAERNSTAVAPFLRDALRRFLHLPKVVLIMMLYLIALYVDCRRSSYSSSSPLRLRLFLRRVGVSFCQLLPAYPILAILISFGFLFVINFFEFMKWNVEILNAPIYYGTLYGPFSLIYWNVKRGVMDDARSLLPTTSSARPPHNLERRL
jgi:hypothetical protein